MSKYRVMSERFEFWKKRGFMEGEFGEFDNALLLKKFSVPSDRCEKARQEQHDDLIKSLYLNNKPMEDPMQPQQEQQIPNEKKSIAHNLCTDERISKFLKCLDEMQGQIVFIEGQLENLKNNYWEIRDAFFPKILATMSLKDLEKAVKNTMRSTAMHLHLEESAPITIEDLPDSQRNQPVEENVDPKS